MGKTNLQGTNVDANLREVYRRLNDYASVTATFTAANTQTSVTHTLGRPPVGWSVLRVDKAASVYSDAATLGTASLIRLKCDNSNVVATLRVF